jgi:hypothetical protein
VPPAIATGRSGRGHHYIPSEKVRVSRRTLRPLTRTMSGAAGSDRLELFGRCIIQMVLGLMLGAGPVRWASLRLPKLPRTTVGKGDHWLLRKEVEPNLR